MTTTVPVTEPGAPATTVPVDGTATEVVSPRLGGPIGLMKLIVFFAVSALFGGLMFIKLVWPEGVEYGITEKYFRQVSIIAGVAIFVLIILMTTRQSGGGRRDRGGGRWGNRGGCRGRGDRGGRFL